MNEVKLAFNDSTLRRVVLGIQIAVLIQELAKDYRWFTSSRYSTR